MCALRTGADRFEGVEWFPAKNKCPVLKKAISYMECKVRTHMHIQTYRHMHTHADTGSGTSSGVQLGTVLPG